MARAVGIDLGTTNSCVAVLEGGDPVVVANSEGSRTTPSVVAFARNGEVLVGQPAKNQAVTNVDRTIRSVKRHMGTDWSIEIDGKDYTAQEISARVLQKLKRDAESYLGEDITDAVITVPAYFDDAQRTATNNLSCVVWVRGERGSALLTGDLDARHDAELPAHFRTWEDRQAVSEPGARDHHRRAAGRAAPRRGVHHLGCRQRRAGLQVGVHQVEGLIEVHVQRHDPAVVARQQIDEGVEVLGVGHLVVAQQAAAGAHGAHDGELARAVFARGGHRSKQHH